MTENSLDEYLSPDIYESEYGGYKDDFNIFLGLKTTGSALDLACGTGRLTIPLAKSGLKCTGLDTSCPMLEYARQKSVGLQISYLEGDIRSFSLNQKFDLITMAGNAFQALLGQEEQESMLRCVRAHLKPDGLFIFNTRNPLDKELVTTYEFEYWHSFQDATQEEVQVYGRQEADLSRQIITYFTQRIWKDKSTTTTLQLRFTSYEKLMKLLVCEGFEVYEVYGNAAKTPFYPESPSIIPLCKLR